MTIKQDRLSQFPSPIKHDFYGTCKCNQFDSFILNALKVKVFGLFILTSLLYLYSPASQAADEPCQLCHAQVAQTHQSTPHGKAAVACKSCHGDGTLHISQPNASNISTFPAQQTDVAKQQYGVCNDCHNNSHDNKPNAHKATGISCGSCHSIHATSNTDTQSDDLLGSLNQLPPGSRLCFDCHQDSFTQFEFNERHRLTEGVVACTSCHDPHNPQLGMQLGGFKQSVCSDCHADVTGPFVFEHGASRVEGCGACHEPHGSPNRHMLKIQEVGSLCYSCHADAPQFHLGFSPTAPPRFNESTVCTNCHVSIHGSNLDRTLLR